MIRAVLGSALLLGVLWTSIGAEAASASKTSQLVIGGEGRPWEEVVEQWIALDDAIYPGAVLPREIRSGENILRSAEAKEGEQENIFGYGWAEYKGRSDIKARGYELG